MTEEQKNVKNVFICCTFTAVLMLLILLVGKPVEVSGSSMEPNYRSGDFLMMEKVSLYRDALKRFDVVVFPDPSGKLLIKRIIGLPGETIRIDEDGSIYVDGEVLKEGYGKETIKPVRENGEDNLGYAREEIVLGKDEYFVLGDNRNDSEDSRFIGPVKLSDMKGKIWFRII